MLKNIRCVNNISVQIYSLFLFLLSFGFVDANGEIREYYIVFMEDHRRNGESVLQQMHIDVLSDLKGRYVLARVLYI